jgi:hypothetical protein
MWRESRWFRHIRSTDPNSSLRSVPRNFMSPELGLVVCFLLFPCSLHNFHPVAVLVRSSSHLASCILPIRHSYSLVPQHESFIATSHRSISIVAGGKGGTATSAYILRQPRVRDTIRKMQATGSHMPSLDLTGQVEIVEYMPKFTGNYSVVFMGGLNGNRVRLHIMSRATTGGNLRFW